MHVLLIDDEQEFLDVMKVRLEKRAIVISLACGGKQGLSMLDEITPDAVIVDLKMPEMDGLEVLSRIKSAHPQLPVLLLTGYASVEAGIAGVQSGAADYIFKPVQINDLITRLTDIVNK